MPEADDRLDRIEASLERLVRATADGFAATTGQLGVIRATLSLLDTRMTLLEGQMVEALGRLQIIGEQLATHSHGEA